MAYTKTNWTETTPINTANLNNIENGISELYNAIFPIGQIVIKGDSGDYSNWLGFTWERTAVGKVLVGYDSGDTDFNSIGKTGGEKKHTLTKEEMAPTVWHSSSQIDGIQKFFSNGETFGISTQGTDLGQPHNNLQPYQVVAYWKRIS